MTDGEIKQAIRNGMLELGKELAGVVRSELRQHRADCRVDHHEELLQGNGSPDNPGLVTKVTLMCRQTDDHKKTLYGDGESNPGLKTRVDRVTQSLGWFRPVLIAVLSSLGTAGMVWLLSGGLRHFGG